MEGLRIIPFNHTVRQRWRNDGGWTREIHREGGADDWTWRLSIAEVETDGPFSRFEGIEREIVLLSGAGMCLDFADGRRFELRPESPRQRFAGEAAVDCRLIDGPTTDFNLMWSRDRVEAQLWLRPLTGGSVLDARPGETWAVHLLSGQLALLDAGSELAPGDTVLVRAGEAAQRQRMDAAGSAIFIRLRSRAD